MPYLEDATEEDWAGVEAYTMEHVLTHLTDYGEFIPNLGDCIPKMGDEMEKKKLKKIAHDLFQASTVRHHIQADGSHITNRTEYIVAAAIEIGRDEALKCQLDKDDLREKFESIIKSNRKQFLPFADNCDWLLSKNMDGKYSLSSTELLWMGFLLGSGYDE